MQQRQFRLGDIVDDYCPRERRLANHTIVAMVGDNIRLTRCTTCETEHPYKDGKAPRLRKKKTPVEAAYGEVLRSVTQDAPTPAGRPAAQPNPAATVADEIPGDDAVAVEGAATEDAESETGAAAHPGTNGDAPAPPGLPEEVRLHRPLIRAQLPRLEREPVARAIPEFTIRQASKRQGRFQPARPPGRFAKSGQDGQGNSRGQGGSQHGMRHGGKPHGSGSPSHPAPSRHPGRKRSR